jgi:hypothetical protein
VVVNDRMQGESDVRAVLADQGKEKIQFSTVVERGAIMGDTVNEIS